MRVIKFDEVVEEERIGGIFEGRVTVKALVNESIGSKDLKLDVISFPPGVRNKPHVHEYDQALYILDGKGIVATDQEEVIATPGMLVFIPAGEKHWHGATNDTAFSHISILRPGTVKY